MSGRERGGFWLGPWLVFSTLMGTSIVAAMALMVLAGDASAAVPAVMVAGVALASLVAAGVHLRPARREAESRVLTYADPAAGWSVDTSE